MVGDLGLRLFFDVQPDERKERDQGQGSDEAAEFVAALRCFGHDDDDRSSEHVLGYQPTHHALQIGLNARNKRRAERTSS